MKISIITGKYWPNQFKPLCAGMVSKNLMKKTDEKNQFTRRDIIGGAGTVAAGALLAGLPVSVPAHSSLMTAAGEELAGALAEADISTPGVTVIAAMDARPYQDATDIRERLSRQVYGPVQWVATVRALIDCGATSIIECGPGKVLAGLVRRIDKGTPVAFIDNQDSLRKALQG